ncbi:MAG TPA: amino acid racemase [Clostridiales bacterium]|nr:amino acid racemase [Clostridiales bacterium]
MSKTVGIMGGLGPLSTVYFMEMLVNMTDAQKDQDHLDLIVTSTASTPDRTAFITGKSKDSPLEILIEDGKKLQNAGADFIALTCNTAHRFYDELASELKVPLLHMPRLALEAATKKVPGLKKVGLLATDGTLFAGVYEKACEEMGLDFERPDEEEQKNVMKLIYEQVKAGKEVDTDAFLRLIEGLKERGCGAVILGCTELSIIERDYGPFGNETVDALEALAKETIRLGGKNLKFEKRQ